MLKSKGTQDPCRLSIPTNSFLAQQPDQQSPDTDAQRTRYICLVLLSTALDSSTEKVYPGFGSYEVDRIPFRRLAVFGTSPRATCQKI